METAKIVLLIVLCHLAMINAKVFRRCEFARELVRLDFDRTLLTNWVCMAEHESGLDTRTQKKYMPGVGTHDPLYTSYGIFQINDKNYCRKGFRGGKCNLICDELLTDNITKAAQCAKVVFANEGFKAWKQWEQKCKKKELPNLNECFRNAGRGIGG